MLYLATLKNPSILVMVYLFSGMDCLYRVPVRA